MLLEYFCARVAPEHGWRDLNGFVANFENEETDKLSLEIYERPMLYFKGKKAWRLFTNNIRILK
ncbi:hypothetical protein GKS28_18860 [Bacillus paralicheniformis]|nr:hypothetical protein [Bacillus paralicheniformis]QAT53304.1 hypothetical protein EQY74_10550 [Bacillus licheniformis]MSO04827.1 hypothetical protein [Bacillus paralicheniformis]MSO08820.1 hypothetical protein [Bacillus paralicheniformis]MSO12814.1 hypothetical protein [Bacillus paralicheniformis]